MITLDIRHLLYFSEVAKQLNFTKAATILHVSQPALSKTIKGLETELGVTLFYRASHQLELTDAGEAFLINAKQVLDAFDNLKTELNDVKDLKKGEIRIGIPPIIGAAFFSKLISRFIEDYPEIEITLTEVGSKKIKDGVEEGSLDIGLICNLPVQESSFKTIELLRDPLHLIVHKHHSLAAKKTIDFTNIADESFILYRQDFTLYDSILDACSKHGFTPHIVCESSQKEFMLEMVEAKLGVALLPSKICEEINNDQVVALPFVKPKVNLNLGLIWKKNKYLPFAVREFITMSENLTLEA